MELVSKQNPPVAKPQPEWQLSQPLRVETYENQKCLDKLTYLIVRPPRVKYNPMLIRSPLPSTHKMQTFKIPFELTVFAPERQTKYCILYLHGNSSCRLEGMNMVKEIPSYAALACFDFEGCGNGTDAWVTLGIKQSKQVNVAARFLQEKGFTVVGWGRSMGAVSVLLSDIKVMIVDSAFCSLKELCSTVAQTQVKWMPSCLFQCLFSCVFCLVKSDFHSKTSQQIEQLSILSRLISDPLGETKSAIFISGDQDIAIDSSHSKRLHHDFKGQKDLLIFKGSHNSTRPRLVYNKCLHFIQQRLNTVKFNYNETVEELKGISKTSQNQLVQEPQYRSVIMQNVHYFEDNNMSIQFPAIETLEK